MNLDFLNLCELYPQLKNKHSLIAVSGGVDSILLSHLFSESKLKFSIAHCNFGLRGKESDKDSILVRKLAKSFDVDFYYKKFDTLKYSKINKCSIQMAAREIRYNWFDELMIQNKINYLITGHHLNDQLETFMINLGRGTGIEGLVGISENSKILRPLLNFTKKEIILYAKKKSYKWNLDQTNLKNDYLRNSLRNNVVAEWKKIIPDLEKNFLKTISQIGYAEKALKTQVDYFKKNYFILKNSEFQINIKKLLSLTPQEFYFNSLFKEFGFVKSSELIKLINSSPGKLLRSDSYEILKDREYLFLRKIKDKQNKSYKINLIPQKLNDPFKIEISLKPFKNKRNSIEVDPSLLSPILEIKKPYTGAYFYPSGMSGKKKLSKYFKDEKLSLFEKQNQWILTSNNQVVWVIGKRADNRFSSSLKSNKRMYISIELS
tara:strand:- start:2655 stop:3953 length:1299 start_codon:yes stop_codon:yes gene_type:complete